MDAPSLTRVFIADANVLIDYLETNEQILALLASKTQVIVATPVFDEVGQLSSARADELGLQIQEPTMNHFLEAASSQGALSEQDVFCLAMARDNGWVCITNDKPLRLACSVAGVETCWGLQLMLIMVETELVSADDALATAREIHAVNPCITDSVLADFCARIRESV